MNARIKDLQAALRKGEHTNKNHRITLDQGIEQNASWCQACPDSLRCFLTGNEIDINEALAKQYPCVKQQRYIRFYYHGSCCLVYDQVEDKLTDVTYWGYSVSTSRAIRWYLDALAHHHYIPHEAVSRAIAHFKKDTNGYWFYLKGAPRADQTHSQ